MGRGAGASRAVATSPWRDLAPVAYDRPLTPSSAALPLLVLLAVLIVPTLVFRRRRSAVRRRQLTVPAST